MFILNLGTSACACALSASFDSLSGGSIGRSIAASIGTIFGKKDNYAVFSIVTVKICNSYRINNIRIK